MIERLIRVETLLQAVSDNFDRSQDEAQQSRHRTNNALMDMQGKLSVLIEKAEIQEEADSRFDVRIKPLESDFERRKFIRRAAWVGLTSCASVFAFMWQFGGSIIAAIAHLGGAK